MEGRVAVDVSPSGAGLVRRRLGGRWAISWQGFLIGKVAGIPALVLTGGTLGGHAVARAELGKWLAVALCGVAVAGAVVWGANVTVFRHRREHPLSPWITIVFYVLVGLVYGANNVLLGYAWGLSEQAEPVERIFSIMTVVVWWNLTFAWLMGSRDDYIAERQARIDTWVSLELAVVEDRQIEQGIYRALSAEVSGSLSGVRALVDKGLSMDPADTDVNVEEWTKLASSLREAADTTVRPLSHRLWQEASSKYPSPKARAALRRLLSRPVFQPAGTFAIIIVGYLPSLILALGLVEGSSLTLAWGLVVAVLMWGANRLMHRMPMLAWVVYLTVTVGVLLAGAALTSWQVREGAVDGSDEFLGGLVATLAAVLLPSAVATLSKLRTEQLHGMDVEAERILAGELAIARRSSVIARTAARTLHGSVQTRLIACAAAIDLASSASRASDLRHALAEAAEILGRPLESARSHSSVHASMESSLLEVIRPWEGLLNVCSMVEESARDLSATDAARVAAVVEEALVNAYRHGHAQSVTITTTVVDGAVRVIVADDGEGPPAAPMTGGLGSRVLEDIAGFPADLTRGAEGGAVLVVHMDPAVDREGRLG